MLFPGVRGHGRAVGLSAGRRARAGPVRAVHVRGPAVAAGVRGPAATGRRRRRRRASVRRRGRGGRQPTGARDQDAGRQRRVQTVGRDAPRRWRPRRGRRAGRRRGHRARRRPGDARQVPVAVHVVSR